VRIVVVAVAALIVAGAVWISKARKSELMVEDTGGTDVARQVETVT
jgi:hypothetical protein